MHYIYIYIYTIIYIYIYIHTHILIYLSLSIYIYIYMYNTFSPDRIGNNLPCLCMRWFSEVSNKGTMLERELCKRCIMYAPRNLGSSWAPFRFRFLARPQATVSSANRNGILPVSLKETLLLRKPLPCNKAAETAIQPLSWCLFI